LQSEKLPLPWAVSAAGFYPFLKHLLPPSPWFVSQPRRKGDRISEALIMSGQLPYFETTFLGCKGTCLPDPNP
jgi:hypothetical protein